MRSLSSIFGAKPSDKPLQSHGPSNSLSSRPTGSAVHSKKHSRFFSTISRKNVTDTQRSPFVNPNVPTPSSRSSSTGSNSLPTPGDEETLIRTTDTKLPWKSWVGGKKSSSTAKRPAATSQQWAAPQAWRSLPPTVLQQPPSCRLSADDTEDETSSESEDESDAASSFDMVVTRTPAVTRRTSHNSLTNFRIVTENGLRPPFSPPPLLFVPGQPVFPRSSNLHHALYQQETLESRMHRTRILRCVDSQQVTRAQELSIISFGTQAAALTKRPSLQLNEEAVPNTFQSRTFSQGLQKWALRPCFEDRMDVWVPGEGDLLCTRVTGSSVGVAALEISEHLDVLAGATCDDVELEPPSNSSALMSIPSPSHQGINAPSLPSPLRIEHSSAPPSLPAPVASQSESESRTMPAVPNVKRGVRFAEDDKEDQIPLGHILRIRKRREEKARFLREEKERRAFEQDRVKQEEERAQREAERREWERERLAWEKEKEKRAIEEGRKQRQFAEEVAAARLRRDAARSGIYTPPVPLGMENTRPPLRESKSSRKIGQDLAPISTRRQPSEPVVLATGSGSPCSPSPGSSGPPSNANSPATSELFSRPSSVYSVNTPLSSADDMPQNRKMMNARNSLSVDSLRQPYYPAWSNTYPIPPLPSIPFYNMDMPLLPPTPPFMMHQSRRPQSANSSSNRPSSSRRNSNILTHNNSSSNNTSERVSFSSQRNGSLKHHRAVSSDDVLKGVEKPSGLDRRSGSAADIRDPRLSSHAAVPYSYSQQPLQPSPMSQSPSAWVTASLPRNSRGRPSMSRRQSNIIT